MRYIKLFENFDKLNKISLKNVIDLSQKSDVDDVSEWLSKPINKIKFYYKEEPISMFSDTISEMESTFDEYEDEFDRTEYILDLLEVGGKPMPIFVELNDESRFIMEGRHRIVAFSWFGMDKVPVIYVI